MTSSLHQQMLHDLQLAGLSERTQDAYTRAVRKLADHFHTPPDRLSEQRVREYFLHLKNDRHFAAASLGIAYSGIKFFYSHTIPRDWPTPKTPPRPAGEAPPRRPLHGRGPPPHRRRPHTAQPRLFLDRLLAGTPPRRGAPPPGPRHRQRPHDGPRPSRQGRQGPLRPPAVAHAEDPPRIPGHPSPSALALPRHRPRPSPGRLRRRPHGTLRRPGRCAASPATSASARRFRSTR